jgi:hypothetical protein
MLDVKVVPGASRSEIAGAQGEALRVRVAAPPERGRANEELRRVLAAALGVPLREVEVVAGASSPRKTVLVRSLPPDDVVRRLGVGGARGRG